MKARTAGLIVAGIGVLLAGLVLAAAWYYSNQIRSGVLEAKPPSAPVYGIEVLAVGDDTITLERAGAPADLTTAGTWGVRNPAGYGQLGRIERVRADRVVRRYEHLTGSSPEEGDGVAIESAAFPSDPETAHELHYEEVEFQSDLGPTPAWLVEGSRPTWVVYVHGLNASRREALRLLEPVARAGFPSLVIAYRNDPEAPETESGLREWGRAEWRDVEAAVGYALDRGASQVALVGYSMGGATVASFLYESELADEVSGAVLDAPALDLAEIIEFESGQRRLPVVGTSIPAALPDVARTLTSWRFGVDWDRLDYVERADELEVPALVVHGTEDASVPLATSEEFARARPDLVTLLRFPGAGHVRAWNLDRRRYERRIVGFLERVSPPAADS